MMFDLTDLLVYADWIEDQGKDTILLRMVIEEFGFIVNSYYEEKMPYHIDGFNGKGICSDYEYIDSIPNGNGFGYPGDGRRNGNGERDYFATDPEFSCNE